MLRFVTRVRRRWLAIATVALPALALVAAACSDTADTAVNPTTGILVRAETLTNGKGCGTAASNVYKYAVVVFGYNGVDGGQGDRANYTFPLAGNVYDCFADGEFISLDAPNGSSTYRLEVYAYNRAAYEAAQGQILAAAGDCFRSKCTDTRGDAGLLYSSPTWTTVCTATQLNEVESLAVCDPLAAGTSGLADGSVGPTSLTLDTTTFHLPDGRVAACGPGIYDAGTDAATDAGDASIDAGDAGAAGDAGDAGDAGVETVPFATARIRYRIGATVGPTVDLACPAQFSASVASEAATYSVDVGLIDSAGTVVGQTLCTGTAVPGQSTAIVCP